MLSSLRFRLWLTCVLIIGVVISIAGAVVLFYLVRQPADNRQTLSTNEEIPNQKLPK